ncbi:ankyrin repeat protein, partial [Trifolium medium]|nr:ankyrin repeat protein [Trifolium medium]
MVKQGGNDLLAMKIKADGDKGDIPVILAAAKGHKEMTRFLFYKTKWSILLDNESYYAANYKLLSHCIHVEIFDVAASLLQQDGTQIPLSYESDQLVIDAELDMEDHSLIPTTVTGRGLKPLASTTDPRTRLN